MARQHLEGLARVFVTEKTIDYSEPMVEIASESLGTPLVQKMISNEQAAAMRREIEEYQSDPAGYVSDLTRRQGQELPAENGNSLVVKVAAVKEKIRKFYNAMLSDLIRDVRIFSLSNLIAGAIALGLALRSSPAVRQSSVLLSFLIFVAVLYCSYLYVDGLTFFRILFRTRMGLWYPVFLCVMIVALYLDYGRRTRTPEESKAHGTANGSRPNRDPTTADR